MTEKQRIASNNNGEAPYSAYDIVRIKGIANPADELATFKFLDFRETTE
jgi:hypothetical protein